MAGDKTGSSAHRLSALQRAVLARFFALESSFHLSGGAALVGYYLHHRTTDDLDLFTSDPEGWERSRRLVGTVANDLGATVETKLDSPDFRRQLLLRPPEAVVLDLVFDRVPPLVIDKPVHDGVRMDPPEELLANKLTALVSRSEERDLVDVMFLERAGFSVESALPGAQAKDGACTPGQLAFLLSEVAIPDQATLPGEVAPAELQAYLADLVRRLRRLAHPG